MKAFTTSIVALALVASTFAQGKERPLWPNGTPGAKGDSPRDIPTLTPFLAPAGNNSGSAIVICPGGGYGGLAAHEGAIWVGDGDPGGAAVHVALPLEPKKKRGAE